MGNILQNSLDVTYDDFLKGVFGARSKPERNALKSLFSEIVTGKSTLVSDLSKPLRANASKAECKRAQERVSGWLGNYDFVEATGGWLLKNIPEDRLDGPVGGLLQAVLQQGRFARPSSCLPPSGECRHHGRFDCRRDGGHEGDFGPDCMVGDARHPFRRAARPVPAGVFCTPDDIRPGCNGDRAWNVDVGLDRFRAEDFSFAKAVARESRHCPRDGRDFLRRLSDGPCLRSGASKVDR